MSLLVNPPANNQTYLAELGICHLQPIGPYTTAEFPKAVQATLS